MIYRTVGIIYLHPLGVPTEETMYICLCKGITEEKIEDLVNTGLPTKEVLKRLGVGSDCGICVVDAIEKAQAKAMSKDRKAK